MFCTQAPCRRDVHINVTPQGTHKLTLKQGILSNVQHLRSKKYMKKIVLNICCRVSKSVQPSFLVQYKLN